MVTSFKNIILLLPWFLHCHGTLVLDLDQSNEFQNEDGKTTFSLDPRKEISIPITFCLRFNLQNKLSNTYMFSNKDDVLAMTLRFPSKLGTVYVNKEGTFFEIPENNDIIPYHWHHICVAINKGEFCLLQ